MDNRLYLFIYLKQQVWYYFDMAFTAYICRSIFENEEKFC
jgi:hypothetical protein